MKRFLFVLALQLCAWCSYSQCLATSTPTNDGTDGDAIDYFILNGVASTGNNGCPSNGYNSFSSPVRTLALGVTYTFAATVGGPSAYDEGLAIWIDLNNDGSYANAEQLYASSTWATSHSGSVTIPFTAVNSATVHMRVRCAYNTTISSNQACLDDIGGYGETEDYVVYLGCPAPSLSIAPSNTLLCLGESTTLTALGGQSYTWTGGSSAITNGVGFTPTTSASYTVFSSVVNCPGSSSSAVRVVSVTSTPLNVTTSVSSANACAGQTLQLQAFGATNYTWLPGNFTLSSPIITASANTIFTVVGYNGSGCAGSASVNLVVTTIAINLSASSTSICPGEVVTLTVSGANSYTWSPNNATTTTISVSPTSPTIISVAGQASNCIANAAQLILVSAAPTLSMVASKTLVCESMSVNINALGFSDSYLWGNGQTTSSVIIHPTSTAVYSVTGTFTNSGCSATSTLEITVFKPNIVISPSTALACPGTVITLTASGGTSGYSWTPGGSIFSVNTITLNGQNQYTASAFSSTTAGLSCPGLATISVSAYPPANITASINRPQICKGEYAILTATGAVSYLWLGSNSSTSASLQVAPVITGSYVYTVQGTDANGCVATASVLLKVNSCNGLEEFSGENEGLSIYPNPSNGVVTIQSQTALSVRIINELGQTLKSFYYDSASGENLQLKDLSPGIYFLVGEREGKSFTKKLVIKQ